MAGAKFPSPRARSALDMSGAMGIVRYDLTEDQYVRAFEEFSVTRRYRLTDVRGYEVGGYEVGGRARYAAIWEQSDTHPGHASRHDITPAELGEVAAAFAADGLRPRRLAAYVIGAATRFAGIWEWAGGPECRIHWDIPAAGLHEHAEQARASGHRIIDVCGYAPATSEPRESLIASIWEAGEGPGWTVTGPVDADGHQRDFDRRGGAGWRPVRTNGWYAGRDGTLFTTLWSRPGGSAGSADSSADSSAVGSADRDADRGAGEYRARHGIDSAGLARALEAQDADGLRLEQLGAYSLGSGMDATARFCPVWTRREAWHVVTQLVAEFARDFDVPGVALAVARRGRLVLAHGRGVTGGGPDGRGVTDGEPDGGEPISAHRSLFRIASISKPITSAAVMALAGRGLLTLDDAVFGPGGHLAGLLTGPPSDPRVTGITVRHLLQHACGGWAGDAHDPMFTLPELSAAELIDATVRTRPLDHDPGTHYAYSNFGYCILGRLIEKVTGTGYERHLRRSLLTDCGITGMCLAADGRHGRRPHEVTYHGSPDPYGLPVRRMDSHGGWLASAVDLLRFAVRVGGSGGSDVLAPRWIAEMAAVPDLAGSEGYGAGWGVHPDGTRSHFGRLPGTSAVLALTPEGLCISILTNTDRAGEPPDPTSDTIAGLNQLMGAIRERVDFWPTGTAL